MRFLQRQQSISQEAVNTDVAESPDRTEQSKKESARTTHPDHCAGQLQDSTPNNVSTTQKSGDCPGRIKYPRDYLLSFRSRKECKDPPKEPIRPDSSMLDMIKRSHSGWQSSNRDMFAPAYSPMPGPSHAGNKRDVRDEYDDLVQQSETGQDILSRPLHSQHQADDDNEEDKPTEQDLYDEALIAPFKKMTSSANKDVLLTADSGKDDSNTSASSSDVEDIQSQVKAALKNGSVKVEVVKSVFLGPPGVGKTQLKQALLGDFREVKESTNVSTQAAPAVEVFLADTTHKKWEPLNISHLNKLSMDKNSWSDKQWSNSVDSQVTSSSQSPNSSTDYSVAVKEEDIFESRSKLFEQKNGEILKSIAEARSSSTDKPTEQDLYDEALIAPFKKMTFSANKDALLTADSGKDDSNTFASSSDVEDIQSQVKAALKNGFVKVEVVKSVFLGPPGVGKTQLKHALLGDFREVKESTNVSTQAAPAVEVFVADTTHKKWEPLNISHLKKLSMDKNSWSAKQWPKNSSADYSVAVKDEAKSKLFEQMNEEFFKSIAAARSSSTEPLKFKLVYIIDNGGQPSFLDFHSATATFAASYVLLFDACKGLDAFPEMALRKTEFPIRNMPPSIYSNFDLLRRSLLTVYHFNCRFGKKRQMIESLMKNSFQAAPNPHVLIVGTHKDDSLESNRCADEARLNRICDSLPSLKHQWDIRFVDSLNQQSENLSDIRKTMSLKDNVCEFDLPLSWFQVYLLSLQSDKSLQVQKYDDLYKMCLEQNHVKSPEEFKAMITVMHCLGVFCIPELEQPTLFEGDFSNFSNFLIFVDPSLLFDYLSRILAIPFREPSSISCSVLRELQSLGELTPDCLAELDIPDNLGTLPGFHKQLLGWLVNWRLAAKKDGEDRWFIPSVLPPRPKAILPFVPGGRFRDLFPLYFTFQPEDITSSNRSFHYLPAGFFSHLVVRLMQTGRFCLPENSRKDQTKCPYRCRDSIYLEERDDRNSKQYTFIVCLVDESDRLAVHMKPDNSAFVSDLSALHRAGTILAELKKYMIQTNERKLCTSIGNIALCSACRCKLTSSPQSSSQPVQPALIHLAKVGFNDSSRKFWLKCLSASKHDVDDDSLIEVLLGFSGQAQVVKSTGSGESETVDTLPDTPIVKLETTPIAGRETTEQRLEKCKDNFISDASSQSVLQPSKVDDIIPSPVCFEVEASCAALWTLPLEKDLIRIANNCGNHWKSLLALLGVKNTKMQEFEKNESTLSDACFQGLVFWLDGNADDSDPVNWRTLLTAMKDAGMKSDAREWKQKIVERCH